MERKEYKITQISGDYAILSDENGETSKLALALLPPEADEGDTVAYENFSYELLR